MSEANEPQPPPSLDAYTVENIQVLRDGEHIRRRPSMYIGSTDTRGLHYVFSTLLDEAVAETQAGGGSTVAVRLAGDGSVSVTDSGPGWPVERHPQTGESILARVLTLGLGGLHGMSPAVACALAERMEVAIRRDRYLWRQSFQRGEATSDLQAIGPAAGTGTTLTFKPDHTIFSDPVFDAASIADRMFELSCLHPAIRFSLRDERTGQEQVFHHPGGLADLLRHLNREAEPWHSPIHLRGREGDVEIAVALQYVKGQEEVVRGYTNAQPVQVGTHVSGLRMGLIRAVMDCFRSFLRRPSLLQGSSSIFCGEDFRTGRTSVVAVTVPEPQFGGAIRYFLMNPEVESAVAAVVRRELAAFLEDNPVVALTILGHVLQTALCRWPVPRARRRKR